MTVTAVASAESSPNPVGVPCLRTPTGRVLALPTHRWLAPPSPAEHRLLARVDGPVLDVGCGPARHVLALAQAGIITLGIDFSPPAITIARQRRAPVLRRSIFDRIPGAGRWGTALLLDGNVGIGGCPVTLLRRVTSLLRAEGRVLLELQAGRGCPDVEQVRLDMVGSTGPWFKWAQVGVDDLGNLADRAELTIRACWRDTDRWFAWLER
jgi:SAM-dependent methyltransferase